MTIRIDGSFCLKRHEAPVPLPSPGVTDTVEPLAWRSPPPRAPFDGSAQMR